MLQPCALFVVTILLLRSPCFRVFAVMLRAQKLIQLALGFVFGRLLKCLQYRNMFVRKLIFAYGQLHPDLLEMDSFESGGLLAHS